MRKWGEPYLRAQNLFLLWPLVSVSGHVLIMSLFSLIHSKKGINIILILEEVELENLIFSYPWLTKLSYKKHSHKCTLRTFSKALFLVRKNGKPHKFPTIGNCINDLWCNVIQPGCSIYMVMETFSRYIKLKTETKLKVV